MIYDLRRKRTGDRSFLVRRGVTHPEYYQSLNGKYYAVGHF
jgi:hypothetical protein